MVFTFHFCINCDFSLFKFSSIKQTKCKLQKGDGKGAGEGEEAWQRHQVVVSALFELTHWKLRRVEEGRQGKGKQSRQSGSPSSPHYLFSLRPFPFSFSPSC